MLEIVLFGLLMSDDLMRMQETRYGCCDDGHTIAEGPRGEGCPSTQRLCRDSQYGCCPDGLTSAAGQLPVSLFHGRR